MKHSDRDHLTGVVLLSAILLLLLLLPGHVPTSSSVYIKYFSVFEDLFKEPFETLVVLFDDWSGIAITTQDADRVDVPEARVVEEIKACGKELENVFAIVHNHQAPFGFSPQNHHFYHYLKDRGFDGVFLIYYPFSGKVKKK